MTYNDTHPIILAVQNVLVAAAATLEVTRIDPWPSYLEGVGGPAISLHLGDIQPRFTMTAYPTLHFDKVYPVTISYWSEQFQPRNSYQDVVNHLDAIIDILLQNVTLAGTGQLFDGGDVIGPRVSFLPTNNPQQQLFGGQITVPVTISVTRVQS